MCFQLVDNQVPFNTRGQPDVFNLHRTYLGAPAESCDVVRPQLGGGLRITLPHIFLNRVCGDAQLKKRGFI